MTPQYSTIRKFSLLCVLKDFSEEYSGDIDAGGADLNVTFSIVGENPDEYTKENATNGVEGASSFMQQLPSISIDQIQGNYDWYNIGDIQDLIGSNNYLGFFG